MDEKWHKKGTLRSPFFKFQSIILAFLLVILSSIALSAVSSLLGIGNDQTEAAFSLYLKEPVRLIGPLIFAPVTEELIFRLWLPNRLKKRFTINQTALLSAGIFAALHMDVFFLPYFLNALIYFWLTERTGDIRTAMLVHALYNLSVFLLMFKGV